MSSGGAPALFLDRDGVINRDIGYLIRPEDVEFIPGIIETVAALSRRGYRPVVVTNQSGIARGLYSEADFHALTAWMGEQFAAADAPLAGVYFCPHHPDAGEPPYRRTCDCRKPAAGMLLRAAEELGLDLSRSILLGDSERDIEAGRAAGLAATYLLAEVPPATTRADAVLSTPAELLLSRILAT